MTFDVVLFGATGFTGGLTANYLAEHAPDSLRWAIAGRDPAKLAAVRDRLAEVNARCAELPTLTVDARDQAALTDLAAGTSAVVSTVGPYLTNGEPLVAACAATGADYLDLTGEPEFVDLMYARYHHQAVQSGARLIHCCGFDSIPHDLGAYFTVRQLPDDRPIAVAGIVRAGGVFSGGTVASALNIMSRPWQGAAAARSRRRLEGSQAGRQVQVHTGTGRPRHIDGLWALPLPTIDAQVVARSARALPAYGPDFSYHHYAGFRQLPAAAGAAAGAVGLVAAAQLPPVRSLITRQIQPGTGPDAARRVRGWFQVRFVARSGDRRLITQVSGGDPGYDETAKMLAESALCLVGDELPATRGQVTTAMAFGDRLIQRLVRAGIRFETVSDEG